MFLFVRDVCVNQPTSDPKNSTSINKWIDNKQFAFTLMIWIPELDELIIKGLLLYGKYDDFECVTEFS